MPRVLKHAHRMLPYLHDNDSAMRTRLTLCLLAALAPAHAQPRFSVDRMLMTDRAQAMPPQPMTWRYETLEAAQELFDRHATRYAPNALLTFRLPQFGASDDRNVVELVQGGARTALPMAAPAAFMLVGASAPGDARVVVNRHFPAGAIVHPHVQVRSSDLPPGVLRLGDLRVACQAQQAMAKTEGLQAHAVLGVSSLLGFDACDKQPVAAFDAPGSPFDTIVIEDGARQASLAAGQAGAFTLGDKRWSDNARIRFTLNGQDVL